MNNPRHKNITLLLSREQAPIQATKGEVRGMVIVNKGKEKAESEEVLVSRSGWFFMHDDRFKSRRFVRGR